MTHPTEAQQQIRSAAVHISTDEYAVRLCASVREAIAGFCPLDGGIWFTMERRHAMRLLQQVTTGAPRWVYNMATAREECAESPRRETLEQEVARLYGQDGKP